MGNCLKKNKKIELNVEVNTDDCLKCFGDNDKCVSSCCIINSSIKNEPKTTPTPTKWKEKGENTT